MAVSANTVVAPIADIADAYVKAVARDIDVEQAYLFGSYATMRATEDSDIDIAIVSDQFTGNPVEDRLKLMKLRRAIDLRIEPHAFSPEAFAEGLPMANEILSYGVRLM